MRNSSSSLTSIKPQALSIKPQALSGYTLIEMLIAMAIFTSMALLSVAALNQGLKYYKEVMDEGINFWKYTRYFWLNKNVSGIFDYYVEKDFDHFPYFICDTNRLSYATNTPLANEFPVVAWIVKERSGNGLDYSLVYYELPAFYKGFDDIENVYLSRQYRKGRGVVIEEHVTGVEFESYVIDTYKWKGRWLAKYNPRDTKILPEKIRITFKQAGKKRTLMFNVYNNSILKATKDVV